MGSNLVQGTDYHSILEWKADYILRNYVTSIFKDRSKTETCAGFGVFSDELKASVSFRLPNTFKVF